MNRKLFIALPILFLVAFITWNMLTQPGIKDLEGDFKEKAFIRNEQNNGPVVRIYIATNAGEHWDEMMKYGNFMPHTKYGDTKVYFFNEADGYPKKINLTEPHISEEYKSRCLAVYEKDGMGQISLTKYPFKSHR